MESHSGVLWYLAGVTVRSLGLAAMAWAAIALGRVKSPAARHAAWTMVVAGMLVLAATTAVLPGVPVRVLRARPPAPPPAVQTALQAASQAARVSIPIPKVAAPVRESRGFPWDTVVAGVYFAGLLVFAGRLAYGYLLTQRLVRASRVVPRFAVPRFGAGRVYESASIAVPLTVGCMRPKILLPKEWDTWPPEKLDAVMVHERTHVQRADWAIAVLAGVNRCVFWFHPLAWWTERQLTVLAEQACDDASLSQVSSRECYAHVLVEMAAVVRSRGGRVAWEAMAMAKATEVCVRVERILDESRQIWPGVTRARWFAVAACGLPLVYMAAVVRPARVRAQAAQLVPGAVAQPAEQAQGPAPRKPAGIANSKLPGAELAAARQELDRLDAEVTRFKMENMGRFPEQFQANVAQLNSYQMMLSTAHEAISRLQQQRLMLETQLQNNNSLSYHQSSIDDQPSAVTSESLVQLNQRILILRSEVAALSEQLTPNHPSIKRAQASLEALERKHEDLRKGVNPQAAQALRDLTVSNNVLETEMQNLSLQMDEKVRQTEELNRMIASYQSRIESSPRLEQEYAELLRNQGLARQQVEELSRVPGTASGPSLISRRDPEYTAAAKQAGIEGTVELSVTIGTDGVARDIQVIRSLDGGLDRKAIDCVKTWRFRPASRDGKAVTAFASVEVRFRLR